MMRRVCVLLLVLGLAAIPGVAQAQTALAQTRLNVPMGTGSTTATLVSATGVSSGQVLYLGREAMLITALSSATATVLRGYLGTSVASHAVGTVVYAGAVAAFETTDVVFGQACSAASYWPRINAGSGQLAQCVGSLWASLEGLTPPAAGGTGFAPLATSATNVLFPASFYLNFGTTSGTTGYGIRDNAGTPQYKASGGAWTDFSAATGYFTKTGAELFTATSGDSIVLGSAATRSVLIPLGAGVLGMRDSTTAQAFHIYSTYTDINNYQLTSLTGSASAFTIAAGTLGTGADNINIVLTPAGTGQVSTAAVVNAAGYTVGATAGIDKTCGGPVVSATFVKGIMTAMTCTSEPQPTPDQLLALIQSLNERISVLEAVAGKR